MKKLILGTVSDLIADFLYYDRKNDEELNMGEIEKAIESKEITVDEIVAHFKNELINGLKRE